MTLLKTDSDYCNPNLMGVYSRLGSMKTVYVRHAVLFKIIIISSWNVHHACKDRPTYDLREQINFKMKTRGYKWNYQELTSNHNIIKLIIKHIILKNIEF